MSIPIPASSAAGRFASIIDALCHTVPKFIARDRTAGPLIILIFNHLRRLGRQFAVLAARVEAGTLPAPRRRAVVQRAGVPRAPRLLPRGFAWLGALMPDTRVYGHQLQHLVTTDPEMAALLAACPQAARIVRSIFWMTCIRPVPACVRASRPKAALASPRPLREGPLGRDVSPSIPPARKTSPSRGGMKEASSSRWPRPGWPRWRGKAHPAVGPPLKA